MEWVVSTYILVFAGLLLVGGRLADRLGSGRLFLIGLSIFTVASLAAGLAGNVDVLVASRAVQGLGAALVGPPRPPWPSSRRRSPKPGSGQRRSAFGARSARWRSRLGR